VGVLLRHLHALEHPQEGRVGLVEHLLLVAGREDLAAHQHPAVGLGA
jgi:hypothetical protein